MNHIRQTSSVAIAALIAVAPLLLSGHGGAANAVEPRTTPIVLKLTSPGDNGARDDRMDVKGPRVASGADVKLFRANPKTGQKHRPAAAEGVLDERGDCHFVVDDLNGKKVTRYVAKVLKTDETNAGWTNFKGVR